MFDNCELSDVWEKSIDPRAGGREEEEKVEMETETEQVFRGRFRALLPANEPSKRGFSLMAEFARLSLPVRRPSCTTSSLP